MNRILQSISALLIALVLFPACDIIEGERVEGTPAGPTDTTTTQQKVLLEYFTGHTCGTCPPKAALIPDLKNTFGDRLIDIGVHAGPLAEPTLNPDPNAKYKYDFRTAAGNELYNNYSFSSVPNGLVNRTEYNGSVIQGGTAWASAIGQLINQEPVARLEISNTWNESTGLIGTEVKTKFLKDLTATVNLAVYVIENKIVNWQKDYDATPPDVPDYVHKNVLRGSMNTTWGETIANGSITADTEFTNNYNFNAYTEIDTSFGAAFVPDNSYIVAFIFDESTREILQVEKASLN